MNIQPSEQTNNNEILTLLNSNQTLVYPTETCYGLGCDALNQVAVDMIFDIKHRQREKTVLVLMADVAMAKQYVQWSPMLDDIANKYWPGALTVVAPARVDVELPSGVLHDNGTIAFRITAHPFSHELVSAFGRPIVSTSANIASMESPYDIASVVAMFKDQAVQPDLIIDAGDLPHRSPSTIVALEEGRVVVVRQGEVIINN